MTPDRMLPLLDVQGRVLLDAAEAAGLDRPVPSCPEWTGRDLVRHQGLVHRWATANLLAGGACVDDAEYERQLAYPDDAALGEWFAEGLDGLIEAIVDTPDEAPVWTFFAGESPRRFWLRRQLHETAVHRMDAELAAGRGLSPVGAEAAADGVDELLVGFLTRPTSRLRSAEPWSVAVVADDLEVGWTVRVSTAVPEVSRAADDADTTVTGSADALYAWLWNRGSDGVTLTGDPGVAERWRQGVRIRW